MPLSRSVRRYSVRRRRAVDTGTYRDDDRPCREPSPGNPSSPNARNLLRTARRRQAHDNPSDWTGRGECRRASSVEMGAQAGSAAATGFRWTGSSEAPTSHAERPLGRLQREHRHRATVNRGRPSSHYTVGGAVSEPELFGPLKTRRTFTKFAFFSFSG